jgi:hypothetical protein
VFAVQRPDLTQPLAVDTIFWTLVQLGIGRSGGAIEIPRFNTSATSPQIVTGLLPDVNNTEGYWNLSWYFTYGSCKSFPITSSDESPELDTSSFNFTSHERSILFTTNKTAPNIDLTATDSSETCRTSSNLALNVTDVLHVSSFAFRGYPSCAVLGSTPTQSNPCAVKIDAAAASSVSAAVALEACQATATGYMPCASLKPKSAGHVTRTSTARVILICFGVMTCMLF